MAIHEIKALQAWALREPASHRAYMVVRLTTSSGLEGFGEGGLATAAEVEAARKIVLGSAATAHEAVREALRGVPQMQAAIDIAMLDLKGKLSNAPLYQILGGPTRNKARALAPIHGATNAALAARARALRASGFRAFLVPMPAPAARNQGLAFTETVKQRLNAVRAAAEDADIVLDGAAALTPGDARTLSQALEPLHLLWFDEPCRTQSMPGIRKIADESVTPLGFGRFILEPSEVQALLLAQVLDVLRPNLAQHGITQIRRMAAQVETHYIAVAPFHMGGPIGTAAALHLAAALPNFFIQQVPRPENEADLGMRADLAGGSLEAPRDGFLALPTGPGLGINVSDKVLDKYKEWTI